MAFIAYRNRITEGDILPYVRAGTDVDGHEVWNAAIRQSDRTARIVEHVTFGAILAMDFGAPVLPEFIGLFGVNRPAVAGGAQVSYSDDGSVFTDVAFGAAMPTDLSGTPVPHDIKMLRTNGALAAHQYWAVSLDWTPPAGQDYHEVARLWVSLAEDMILFPEGFDARWNSGVQDYSVGDDTSAGLYWEDERARMRTLGFNVSGAAATTKRALGFDDADSGVAAVVSSLQAMALTVGTTGEIVIAPRRAPLWLHRSCFRGRFASLGDLNHDTAGYWSISGRAVEER
jgi:hypothetical protein